MGFTSFDNFLHNIPSQTQHTFRNNTELKNDMK